MIEIQKQLSCSESVIEKTVQSFLEALSNPKLNMLSLLTCNLSDPAE